MYHQRLKVVGFVRQIRGCDCQHQEHTKYTLAPGCDHTILVLENHNCYQKEPWRPQSLGADEEIEAQRGNVTWPKS